jgi:large subunit ribosomal protein L5
MNNLKIYYKNYIIPKLINKFNYKNIHQIPKLIKITLNMGLGLNAQNKIFLKKAIDELKIISCQYPTLSYSKKSISNFKIRKKMILGIYVTLRNMKMYSFLEKLIKLALPRIRNFQGLNLDSFDKLGNYNLGLEDQLVFPDIDYSSVDIKRGLNINISTSSNNLEENIFLLKEFGLPFKNN